MHAYVYPKTHIHTHTHTHTLTHTFTHTHTHSHTLTHIHTCTHTDTQCPDLHIGRRLHECVNHLLSDWPVHHVACKTDISRCFSFVCSTGKHQKCKQGGYDEFEPTSLVFVKTRFLVGNDLILTSVCRKKNSY